MNLVLVELTVAKVKTQVRRGPNGSIVQHGQNAQWYEEEEKRGIVAARRYFLLRADDSDSDAQRSWQRAVYCRTEKRGVGEKLVCDTFS